MYVVYQKYVFVSGFVYSSVNGLGKERARARGGGAHSEIDARFIAPFRTVELLQ